MLPFIKAISDNKAAFIAIGIPQSWFGGIEPMKGDLHQLFTCQPDCNISRSIFPYADFTFYTPESVYEPIRNHCEVAINEKFEPVHGKGK